MQYTSVRLLDCSKITNHINFTARAKGAEDSDCSMDDLFFAEVTSMIGDDKLVVSCFWRVKTTDNGIIFSYPKSHFVQIKFMSRTNLNLSDTVL